VANAQREQDILPQQRCVPAHNRQLVLVADLNRDSKPSRPQRLSRLLSLVLLGTVRRGVVYDERAASSGNHMIVGVITGPKESRLLLNQGRLRAQARGQKRRQGRATEEEDERTRGREDERTRGQEDKRTRGREDERQKGEELRRQDERCLSANHKLVHHAYGIVSLS
jgi:membrane protein involved in colicin uptake